MKFQDRFSCRPQDNSKLLYMVFERKFTDLALLDVFYRGIAHGSVFLFLLSFLSLTQILTIAMSLCVITITQPIALCICTSSIIASYWITRSILPHFNHLCPIDATETDVDFIVRLSSFAFILFSVCYLILILVGVLKFEDSADGLSYHLPTINRWILAGKVQWTDTDFAYANGYPMATEVVAFLLVRCFGDQVIHLANPLFVLMGATGIAFICRLFRLSQTWCVLAASLYGLIPVNLHQMAVLYVDSPFAASVIALAGVGLLFLRAIISTPSSVNSGLCVLVGFSMGLTIGTKGSGIIFAGLWLFVFVVWMLRDRPRFTLSRLRGMVIIVAVVAAVGGYWMVRNYVMTGSPLYPIGLVVAEHRIFPGRTIAETIDAAGSTPPEISRHSSLVKIMLTWLQYPPRLPYSFLREDARLGGLGYLWLFACVPSIILLQIWAVVKRKNNIDRALYFSFFMIIGSGFLIIPMNWWARYTLWLYALGLPSLGLVVHRLVQHSWVRSILVILISIFCLEIGFSLFYQYRRMHFGPDYSLAFRNNWKRTLRWAFPGLNPTAIDSIMDQRVVARGPYRGRAPSNHLRMEMDGFLSYPLGYRRTIILGDTLSSQMITSLASRGARYIIWDKDEPVPLAFRSAALIDSSSSGIEIYKLR